MTRISARGIDFGAIRTDFAVSADFPAGALAEAEAAVDRHAAGRVDRTDLPLVTIDPPTSMDLDQALHLERTETGFVLHYAIADVAAVVAPGGRLDEETRRRGQTFYLPDGSVPLHPRVLSEAAASLLPDQARPAALWRIELDQRAEPVSFGVTRALVRSVARFDYAGVQADSESGSLHPSIAALPEFGKLRLASALDRGAIELKLPEQEVVADGDGWRLDLQPRTEADDWNAEVSLLTGMCAARLMIDGGVGLVRTLPKPASDAVRALRRTARALGIEWPQDVSVGELLAGLEPSTPDTLVMMSDATALLRGAGYAAFDGTLPELLEHSGIGAPYAHVTAPLRRLSDRFSTEVCLALTAGTAVPQWVREALPALPDLMKGSDSLAAKVDRACVDLTEATLLSGREGERFDAVVLRASESKRDAEIFVPEPAVIAKCAGTPPEGVPVSVRLVQADIDTRAVKFEFDLRASEPAT
ncbi:RNB domain-containing ribonuclease [Rhodococcus tukisamuensis]|uniref:VacB and RNase II family 3'-5' exoribonucleases n=1 Tax=Rhodococcus tukisamuensis TaxID=168276 RepID=A0A1G6WX09_9NOCA|nr:RNB domain-containing ribonuclease [Rhodococcus tukisamuensis]SDD70329.1 VacB and RNase II family 3'-5' exoribonucleases [Rhodococcus tukisamuensis]